MPADDLLPLASRLAAGVTETCALAAEVLRCVAESQARYAAPASTAVPARAPSAALPFPPLEQKVLQALADGRWRSSRALADQLGVKFTSDFLAVLRNLQDRQLIELSTHDGV